MAKQRNFGECPLKSKCKWRSPVNANHPPDYCCIYGIIHGAPPGRVGDYCPAFEEIKEPRKLSFSAIFAKRDKHE